MPHDTAEAHDPTDCEVFTLGCRLNAYESEVMRAHAAAAGLVDAVIVNTCAVTGEAVRQAAQTIRRLRRERPDARIIVTGCAAQIEPHRFSGMPEVDHVLGNHEKTRAETWASLRPTPDRPAPRVLVGDIQSVVEAVPHAVRGFGTRPRGFVEVQNGCDHRCTFCIIPFGRGRSRSLPADAVVAQVRRLVEAGVPEVVLTGVDITSYGGDLPGTPTLGQLTRQVLRQVPELKRLRLSSIDQVETDPQLRACLAEEGRLMPHLHLSMQSGSDMILKRMRRRHSRADAIRFCAEARRLRPDVVLGADLIAGFPTETDEMFEDTLSIVDACGLTFLHVFPYSARSGTPAARMPQVPGATIKARAARLREAGKDVLARYLETQTGREVDALAEGRGIGRTPHYAEVELQGAAARAAPGTILRTRVTGARQTRLIGEVVT